MRGSGGEPRRPARIPLAAALGAVALFAVAVAPWYLRQLAVFGTLSPSTASGKVLFIRDIGEWNSITIPASLDHLLGMGWGPLLMTRVGGLVAALFIFSVLVGALALIPFLLVGAWKRRRDATFGPYFGYAALLFAFSALVSAVHVPGGTFIHSAVALAPHGYVLALLGVTASVGWIAARRERWDAERASRVFVTGAVVFGVVTAVWGSRHRPRRVGTRSASGSSPSTRPSRSRAWTRGPRHVHRRLRDEVLDRSRGRRARQRSDRDRRGGGPRLRHPVAGPGAHRHGSGGGGRHGRRAPGLARLPRRGDAAVLAVPGVHHARGRPLRDRDMSRREAWLTALGIFLFALVVRAVAASAVEFPKPEDTAYYVGVARNLVEGRGMISDALWSYGTPPLVFPRPAFEVWLPLPSLLFAIPIALSGAAAPIPLETALRASQAVTAILGALLCVLAWRLAADVAEERGMEPGRARTLAIGSGLTAAVYLPLLLHAVQPDSTILFGVLAVGACLLMTRVAA